MSQEEQLSRLVVFLPAAKPWLSFAQVLLWFFKPESPVYKEHLTFVLAFRGYDPPPSARPRLSQCPFLHLTRVYSIIIPSMD